jgi:hypothetical protein
MNTAGVRRMKCGAKFVPPVVWSQCYNSALKKNEMWGQIFVRPDVGLRQI